MRFFGPLHTKWQLLLVLQSFFCRSALRGHFDPLGIPARLLFIPPALVFMYRPFLP